MVETPRSGFHSVWVWSAVCRARRLNCQRESPCRMIELGTPKAGIITVGYVPTCTFGWSSANTCRGPGELRRPHGNRDRQVRQAQQIPRQANPTSGCTPGGRPPRCRQGQQADRRVPDAGREAKHTGNGAMRPVHQEDPPEDAIELKADQPG
jgi:hypothetical protein